MSEAAKVSRVKVPPHATEAEQALLGAVLLAGVPAYLEARQIVEEGDLYQQAHRLIWRACATLVEEGAEQIDPILVQTRLQRMGRPALGFDPAYLFELLEAVAGAGNVAAYAREVARTARLRRQIAGAGKVSDAAFAGDETAVARAMAELTSVGDRESTRGLRTAKDALRAYVEEVDRRQSGQSLGLPTGLPALDRRWGGLRDEALIVLAGRPKMGKTILGMQLAWTVAASLERQAPSDRDGPAVLVFSLEMSETELVEREVARTGRIHLMHLARGKLEGGEWSAFTAAGAALRDRPLLIEDSGSLHVDELIARCRHVQIQRGVRLVVVDYLQLLDGGDPRDHEVARLTYISRQLKRLAKELRCPVIALSQLNRSLEDRPNKRPRASDLRGSGSLEQDADIVAFIYRDELYNENSREKGVAEIITSLIRSGQPGTDRVGAKLHLATFEPLADDYTPPVAAYDDAEDPLG